jgi:XTP/dITP diphosphohydrolase
MRLLLATGNPGKVREFRRLLAGVCLDVVTPADLDLSLDVVEDAESYAGNAARKATAYALAAGCMALADDSGIEVDALDGRPGVYSARYGGPTLDDDGRNRLMLEELAGVPVDARTARYRAIVAVAAPGEPIVQFEGTWHGSIALAAKGGRGFGYDPIFLLSDGRTSAELSDDEKDAVSHRGQAMRQAAAYLAGRVRREKCT